MTLATNATQILVPANTLADSFAYTVTDGNGSKCSGTVAISILTNIVSQAVSLDLGNPAGAWIGFTGVPWYFYTAQRGTNVLFTGSVQTWAIRAFFDGSIYIWDDFIDLGGRPPEAYYRLKYP